MEAKPFDETGDNNLPPQKCCTFCTTNPRALLLVSQFQRWLPALFNQALTGVQCFTTKNSTQRVTLHFGSCGVGDLQCADSLTTNDDDQQQQKSTHSLVLYCRRRGGEGNRHTTSVYWLNNNNNAELYAEEVEVSSGWRKDNLNRAGRLRGSNRHCIIYIHVLWTGWVVQIATVCAMDKLSGSNRHCIYMYYIITIQFKL